MYEVGVQPVPHRHFGRRCGWFLAFCKHPRLELYAVRPAQFVITDYPTKRGVQDLNDILIKHPQATFLMRVAGAAMRDVGIDDGDVVLVDRAITPAHGHVVIAVVEDEFVCRRLFRQGRDLRLQGSDVGCADIVMGENQNLQIWGGVTQAIKSMPI